MRTIGFLLYKEFRQIFRNHAILPIIFVAPVLQLIVLAYAANFDVKNLRLTYIDQDHSSFSQRLRSKFEGSPYFVMKAEYMSLPQAEVAMNRGELDLILVIPKAWEQGLMRQEPGPLQLLVDAVDGVKGGLGAAYVGEVVQDFRREIAEGYLPRMQQMAQRPTPQLQVISRNWYNPRLDYKTFMVPGILVLLVTLVGGFLSSMNIVREKEMGTMEQINVTPIRKYQFIIGKLLPFWILALFILVLGLGVAKLLYDIPFLGSFWLLMGFAALYLLVVLGLGLLISTFTDTQQQAMFISWFFLVIFILMSGIFTAIENMPPWAQQVTYLNPLRYFMEVVRMVMLKGAGAAEISSQIWAMVVFAAIINGMAVINYRKTV